MLTVVAANGLQVQQMKLIIADSRMLYTSTALSSEVSPRGPRNVNMLSKGLTNQIEVVDGGNDARRNECVEGLKTWDSLSPNHEELHWGADKTDNRPQDEVAALRVVEHVHRSAIGAGHAVTVLANTRHEPAKELHKPSQKKTGESSMHRASWLRSHEQLRMQCSHPSLQHAKCPCVHSASPDMLRCRSKE